MTPKPRIPGSQAPPNRKPLFNDGRTASTHSKIPVDQATDGKLYRVRDKDWTWVWGANLSYADACKLKEQVVTARKSTTARVEDMAVDPPEWYGSQFECAPKIAGDFGITRVAAGDVAQVEERNGQRRQVLALGIEFHQFGRESGFPVHVAGVGWQLFADFTAQKLVHGNAESFALNIPAGHLDAAHRHGELLRQLRQ